MRIGTARLSRVMVLGSFPMGGAELPYLRQEEGWP
jgi:hypothetical protein